MRSIAFICTVLGRGGAERVTSLLANYCVKRYDIVSALILQNMNSSIEYRLDPRIKVARANLVKTNHIAYLFARRKSINDFLKATNPDIVITLNGAHQADYLGTKLLSSVPLIASKRNYDFGDNGVYSHLMNKVEEHVFLRARGVVFQTESQRAHYSKKIYDKSVVIPNPLQLDRLPHADRTDNEIVTFGRLEEQKRLDLLIDAFYLVRKKHPEFRLTIYGEGSQRDYIRKCIADRGLEHSVRVNSFSDEVHKLISHAKVYVNSSDYEGISNSLIEALAMGMPVVATDCRGGGSRFALEEGGGLLVPRGNAVALADAVCKIIDNPTYADELSNKAIASVSRFDEELICSRWMGYAESIIRKK